MHRVGYFAFVHDEMSESYGVLVTTHEGGNNNTRKMAKLKPTRTKPQSFPFPKSVELFKHPKIF